MAWFTCTDNVGEKVYVNLTQAARMEASGDGTMIYFADRTSLHVKEALEELYGWAIISRLRRRAGQSSLFPSVVGDR
jgi:hypothetical protein